MHPQGVKDLPKGLVRSQNGFNLSMPVGKQGFAVVQGVLGCRQCGSYAVNKYGNDDERFHGVSPKKKGKHHHPNKGKCFP